MGVMGRQVHSALTASNDWFAYYQRYLFPLDLSDMLADAYNSGRFPDRGLWQLALFAPIDFVAGAFGLYFLQPSPALPLVLRVVWRLVVLAGLVALLRAALGTALSLFRRGLEERASRLALWVLLALPAPLPLLLMGKYWAAGKALGMIGPFLFLLAAAPLLLAEARPSAARGRPLWRTLPAAIFLAAQLGFGLARPLAAANPDGIHYSRPPYPSVQSSEYKTALDWGLARRDDALRRCRRIALDIESPFLERYVQLHLTELEAVWWSLRPLNGYFDRGKVLGLQAPKGEPDWLVTDRKAPSAPATVAVISLAR
jgi:hypothetical protein